MKRVLAVLSLCLTAVATPAHAAGCVLSGMNGEFKVAKIYAPGGVPLGIGWQIFDPIQAPLVDDTGYQTSFGMWVFDGPDIRAWGVDVATSGAPRTRMELAGRTLIDGSTPSTRGTGLHGDIRAYNWGSLSGGYYYVVAFGYGPATGALGTGRWSASVSAGGLPCEELDVPGRLVNFNQTHFTGTQAYLPPIGVGSGLRLTYDSQHDMVFGALFAHTTTAKIAGSGVPGMVDLRLGGLHTGTVGTSKMLNPHVGGPGRLPFELDYYGVDPIASITLLDVDLP